MRQTLSKTSSEMLLSWRIERIEGMEKNPDRNLKRISTTNPARNPTRSLYRKLMLKNEQSEKRN